MDKEVFFHAIQNTGSAGQNLDVSSLIDLINEFPYFQSAYLLLAGVYHQQNSPWLEQWLNTVAIHLNDRVQLYSILTKGQPLAFDNQELKELDKLIQQSAPATDAERLLSKFEDNDKDSGGNPKTVKNKPKNTEQAILDNFLDNYHKGYFNKQSNFESTNISEPNNSDDSTITEEQALAYEKQGKLKNAIEIYEKLSLQYPSNFNYFTEKAEALKFNNTL